MVNQSVVDACVAAATATDTDTIMTTLTIVLLIVFITLIGVLIYLFTRDDDDDDDWYSSYDYSMRSSISQITTSGGTISGDPNDDGMVRVSSPGNVYALGSIMPSGVRFSTVTPGGDPNDKV